MKKILLATIFATSVLALAGCGGGGGGGGGGNDNTTTTPTTGTTPATDNSPQNTGTTPTTGTNPTTDTTSGVASAAAGVYTGTNSRGYLQDTLVLPDGRYLLVSSKVAGGVRTLYGFVKGSAGAVAGSISGEGRDFTADGVVSTGMLTGTYRDNTAISGSYREPAGTFTFTGGVQPTTVIDFNRAATVADVQGAWALSTMSKESLTVTIASNGALTGTNGSCNFTGTLTPNAGGKNVFEASVTFGSGCETQGLVATGTAILTAPSAGKQELLIALSDAGNTTGDIFTGTR